MIIDIVREVYIEIEFQCNFRKKGMNCLEFQWFKMGRKMLWNKHRWKKMKTQFKANYHKILSKDFWLNNLPRK